MYTPYMASLYGTPPDLRIPVEALKLAILVADITAETLQKLKSRSCVYLTNYMFVCLQICM